MKSCQECGKSVVKTSGGNKCRSCYYKAWYAVHRRPQQQDLGHCQSCGLEWNSIDPRGKPVKRTSKRFCKLCYGRLAGGKIEAQCEKCGTKFLGVKSLCTFCEKEEKTSNGKAPICGDVEITSEQHKEIESLLGRFKRGTYDEVDILKCADLYLEVFNNEQNPILKTNFIDASMEKLDRESQVIVMLKCLKDIWSKSEFTKKNIYTYEATGFDNSEATSKGN